MEIKGSNVADLNTDKRYDKGTYCSKVAKLLIFWNNTGTAQGLEHAFQNGLQDHILLNNLGYVHIGSQIRLLGHIFIFFTFCSAQEVATTAQTLDYNYCTGRCDEAYFPGYPCYCNPSCDQYENCCVDYYAECRRKYEPLSTSRSCESCMYFYRRDVCFGMKYI